jgi:hypothetical protein
MVVKRVFLNHSHHAEGLINPKVRAKKRLLILDSLELKLANIDRFLKNYFHVFQDVEHTRDSFRTITFKKWDFAKKSKSSNFGQILANFSNIL